MIESITAGLILGMLGSLHCIGMCGPIALSLPVVDNNRSSKYIGTFLYNIGRVLTYAILGLLFGLIGQTFAMIGVQQFLSIFLGVLLLMFLFMPKRLFHNQTLFPGFMQGIRKRIGVLFHTKSYRSLFSIGLLNGLLPCGLVYVAITGAIATGSVFNSSIFMASFGFGTLPMMWLVAFMGTNLKLKFGLQIRKMYPWVIGVMACLLILRGLGLGIPYVSPSFHSNHPAITTVECHDEE